MGLEALAQVLPGGGDGAGGTSLLAPPRPGLGARGGSVPVLPRGPRRPGRCPAGPWPGAGKGDPEAALWGRSGFQLMPLCHRLPRAGDHVLPVLHLAGTALPGQVNLRERHPWSHHGLSTPVSLPGAGAFTPKSSSPAFSGLGAEPGYFYRSVFPYGTAENRVCQLPLLLLPPRGAAATARAPRIRAGEPARSRARC